MTEPASFPHAGDASDEDETYHLLVSCHLEERLASLCRSADAGEAVESSELCPVCGLAGRSGQR